MYVKEPRKRWSVTDDHLCLHQLSSQSLNINKILAFIFLLNHKIMNFLLTITEIMEAISIDLFLSKRIDVVNLFYIYFIKLMKFVSFH